MSPTDPPDYARRNVAAWGGIAADFRAPGERNWARDEPVWGIWRLPESRLRILPDDLDGLDVLELGCGTAYVSAWMTRRGARVVALDPTPAQLATARELQARHALDFPIIEGFAESLPFDDARFDLVFSEYGGCLWADPYLWVPEAARVLRPGGRLIFMTNASLAMLCMPELESDGAMKDRLLRPYLGMHRQEWSDTDEIEFHLPHGEWIELLGKHGLRVERLLELGAPEGATTRYEWADPEWARRFPTEEVWFATRS